MVEQLGLDEADLAPTRRVLARHGNMSSVTVLFVLDEILRSESQANGTCADRRLRPRLCRGARPAGAEAPAHRLIDLKQRSVEPELLDLGVAPEEAVACLRDLRLVNRWLGGRSRLRAAVLPLLGTGSRLLDAGCGSGDLLADLGAHIHHSFLPVGLDIKPLHLKQAPHQIRKVVGDSRALPFPDRSFDVVAASLFLHHFDPHEVAGALTELARCARRALVINDLRRAWLPYAFGRVVFPLDLSLPDQRRRRPAVHQAGFHASTSSRPRFGIRESVPSAHPVSLSLPVGSDRKELDVNATRLE